MEEEKKRYREQQLHKSPRNTNPISKQIPVNNDDEELYPRRLHRDQVALQEETITDHKCLKIHLEHLEHRHSTKALYLAGR